MLDIFVNKAENFAGISVILIIIFHFSSILTIILKLKTVVGESIFLSFLFFVSIISLIMVFGDFALITDIIKEYRANLSGIESEFAVLYFSQFLHLIFYCLIIIYIILNNKVKKPSTQSDSELPLKDETIFINAQYIGLFTGILGLAILASLSIFSPLWAIKKGIVAVCAVLVVPYVAIVIYWLIIKIRERVTEWYDEKQLQDVTKAGLVSFLSSIAILAVFFVFQNIFKFPLLNVIWFPLYFFIVLLIFSGTILYFSKKTMS